MTYELYNCDCLDWLSKAPPNSVDSIMADYPYFGTLDDDWDNQWENRAHFIEWVGQVQEESRRILKPNGSMFVFASAKMAAFVEVETWKRFNVLNHIVWNKRNGGTASRSCKEELRSFISMSERIIFAEQKGSDNYAKGEAGYLAKCDDLRGFVFEPLRKYLRDEWERAGLKPDQANEACGTVSMAGRHFFTQSQWCLPTKEHYAKLQEYANRNGGEFLRKDYEELRRDYEELRRPFFITSSDQYTDVWTFNTSASEGTLHPAQKPLSLMVYMIEKTTRPGATVLDFCMGSGTTGVACMMTGRNFIGCELDPGYFAIAQRRIRDAAQQPLLFA